MYTLPRVQREPTVRVQSMSQHGEWIRNSHSSPKTLQKYKNQQRADNVSYCCTLKPMVVTNLIFAHLHCISVVSKLSVVKNYWKNNLHVIKAQTHKTITCLDLQCHYHTAEIFYHTQACSASMLSLPAFLRLIFLYILTNRWYHTSIHQPLWNLVSSSIIDIQNYWYDTALAREFRQQIERQ